MVTNPDLRPNLLCPEPSMGWGHHRVCDWPHSRDLKGHVDQQKAASFRPGWGTCVCVCLSLHSVGPGKSSDPAQLLAGNSQSNTSLPSLSFPILSLEP